MTVVINNALTQLNYPSAWLWSACCIGLPLQACPRRRLVCESIVSHTLLLTWNQHVLQLGHSLVQVSEDHDDCYGYPTVAQV